MSYDGWVTDGTVYKTLDGAGWIKRHGTFEPFVWLGGCARMDEGAMALGDVTVTQKRNPRGGLLRHSPLSGAPGEATTTLTIKRLQADRKKSDLINCWWDLDSRVQCGGMNEDAWNQWEEITRYCYGKATERSIPAIAFDGDDEEQLINFPWTALWAEDIYRVSGEIDTPILKMAAADTLMIKDVAVCQPDRCPDVCDSQEDCVVVAVTETDLVGSQLVVSLFGGDLDNWTDPATVLTGFGVQDADGVAGVGEFIVVVSLGALGVIYSDDLGATQVALTPTVMATNGPNCVDMVDQSFVIVGGAAGFIFGSYDAARTWETLDAGGATASPITEIMICRSNPQVIYAAAAAADVVIKSVNGGKTWFAVTPTGTAGTGITSLEVVDERHVLVGTDAGELYQTSNGGTTWIQQAEPNGIGTVANVTIASIAGCGCGVFGFITENSVGNERYFYRNVNGGASGKWYQPENMEAVAADKSLNALACCGPNHFVAVGGATGVDDLVMLIR